MNRTKEIIYKLTEDEMFGLIPDGSMIKGYLLFEINDLDGILYFPKNTKYYDEESKRWRVDKGCASIQFGEKNKAKGFWQRGNDYINLSDYTANKVENWFNL